MIKIFYRASICLLEQKNYFYSLKYINKCQELINNNKSNISTNMILMIEEYYMKIDAKILNYILNEKLKFENLKIDKLFALKKFFLSLTNKKYNYGNDKNKSDVENKYLYALNKFWVNKALIFIEGYISSLKKKNEDFFDISFNKNYVYEAYFSNENFKNKKYPPFPGPINNYEITSFKDYLKEAKNQNNFLLTKKKVDEDYLIITGNDWNKLIKYFIFTNAIKIEKKDLELIEIKFILFDKRILTFSKINLIKKIY